MSTFVGTANRQEKRFFSKQGNTAVYYAWNAGQWHATHGRPYRNPFPPGRRHDEYKRGYEIVNSEYKGDKR